MTLSQYHADEFAPNFSYVFSDHPPHIFINHKKDTMAQNTIKIKVDKYSITLPHPINFALQKIIVSDRRANQDKAQKDKRTAITLLKAIIEKKEVSKLQNTFNTFPQPWKNKVIKGLKASDEHEILRLLSEEPKL